MMISKDDGFDLHISFSSRWKRYGFAFLSLILLQIIIYGGSFKAGWYFDDFRNIVDNENVRIQTLSWDDFNNSVYGFDPGQRRINRPLSYLTFALNYYFSGYRVFGYHLVNFIIHYVASCMLFLWIVNTLRLSRVRERYTRTAYPIALLGAVLWATHPLQTTAVTYIVQRMTSMAGMFFISAMYFFVKARTAEARWRVAALWVCALLSGLFSFASKENAVLFPVSMILLEFLFIRGWTLSSLKQCRLAIGIGLAIVIAVGLYHIDLLSVSESYGGRPFTLSERLWTEPRVILFYISLLLYPPFSRLTLLHDFEISTGILAPWTTLPALLALFSLFILALGLGKKRPVLSFSILFFLVNHLVEGSFIPLEIIFEHRNYLPSAFLFVPVSVAAVHVLDYFSYRPLIQAAAAGTFAVLIAAQGHTAYLRNDLFNDPVAFWTDNVRKAENLHRPHHNLAKAYLGAELYDQSLGQMKLALTKRSAARENQKYETYLNLGLFYLVRGDSINALENFQSALEIVDRHPDLYDKIALTLVNVGDLDQAEKFAHIAVTINPVNASFYNTYSWILLKKGMVDKARAMAMTAYQKDRDEIRLCYTLGEAFRVKGDIKTAGKYFNRYYNAFPNEFAVNAALTEIYRAMGYREKERIHVQNILKLAIERGEFEQLLKEYNERYNCLNEKRIDTIRRSVNEGVGHVFGMLKTP